MTYKFDTKVLVSVNPKSGLATENFMLLFRIKYSFLTFLTFMCHSEEPFLFSLTRNCNIVEEFNGSTVSAWRFLQRWVEVFQSTISRLTLRGLSTSARKIELVALAYSALVSANAPISYTQEEISTNLKKEYAEKLKDTTLKRIPCLWQVTAL